VGQFVDTLKTSVISGLTFKDLHGSNCEDGGTALLDDLRSLLRPPDASSPNLSTSPGKKILDDVPKSFHVTEQVQEDIQFVLQYKLVT
jgi:hypothetical protein